MARGLWQLPWSPGKPTLNEAPAGVSASPNVSTGVSSASGKEGARGPAYLSKEKVSEKSSNQGGWGERGLWGPMTLAEDPQIPVLIPMLLA